MSREKKKKKKKKKSNYEPRVTNPSTQIEYLSTVAVVNVPVNNGDSNARSPMLISEAREGGTVVS